MGSATPTLPPYRPDEFDAAVSIHAQRRQQRLPTISTIVGPVGLTCRLWRTWSGTLAVPAVIAPSDPTQWLTAWITALLASQDLCQLAEQRLIAQLGGPHEPAALRPNRITQRDLQTILQRAANRHRESPSDALAAHLLWERHRGQPLTADRLIAQRYPGKEVSDWETSIPLVGELIDLASPHHSPTLLLTEGADCGAAADPLETRCHHLARLATRVPELTLGLALTPALWTAWIAQSPESYAKAVICENALELAPWSHQQILERLESKLLSFPPHPSIQPPAPRSGTLPSGTIETVERIGASEQLIDSLAEAIATTPAVLAAQPYQTSDRVSGASDPELPDPELPDLELPDLELPDPKPPLTDPGQENSIVPPAWKSSQERFLFEVLEHHQQTGGLFQLNASPGFQFGSRAAEVDLLCRSLAIAIEIDGYFHFTDATCYRRDRRKDLVLQQNGYLVLRFLAEDVVPEIEQVLQTVVEAVTMQQARAT